MKGQRVAAQGALVGTLQGQGSVGLPPDLQIYESIFASSKDAIAIVDARGVYLQQNEAHRQLVGYQDEELAGRTPAIHLGEAVFAHIATELAQHGQYRGEHMSVTKTNNRRVIELSAFTIYDTTGAPACHVGIKRDVTERKYAQERLRRHVSQLQAIHVMGERFARATTMPEVQDAALDCMEQALGARRAAVLLHDAQGVMRFTAWRGLSDEYRAIVEGHSPWPCEATDPKPILVNDVRSHADLQPMRDVLLTEGVRALAFFPLVHHGRLTGKLMIYHDVPHAFDEGEVRLAETISRHIAFGIERTRAEEALRTSEEKWRSLVTNAPDFIFTVDRAGSILFLNRSVRFSDPGQAVGMNHYASVPPADRERVERIHERVFETGEPVTYEVAAESSPGVLRWYQNRVGPLKEGGEVTALLVISTDITDARDAAQELDAMRRQLAVSEKLSALGSLVSGVAHEIRTPLTYVSNHTYIAQARVQRALESSALSSDLAATLSRDIETIHGGVERIHHIVEGLRRFTRLKTGGRTRASLHEVVGEAVNLFHATHRARVRVDARLGETPLVEVEKIDVQQVVLNLMGNAAEAMPSGGTIRVTTRPEEDGALIEIADDGPGIPSEIQSRIFDPFFTTKEDGTGLGLSIIRRIVDDHGGSIGFETRPGRGTAFRVFFPAPARDASA